MNKVKYIFRIIKGSSFKRLFKVMNDIHKKTGKNRFIMFFDIMYCFIKYGAGYNDYNIFAFYNMNGKQRSTYVTRVINKKIISMCNDPKYAYIFNDKSAFNERFKDYLKREFLNVSKMNENEFTKFIKNKDVIFAKPNDGESGKGIERLEKKNFKTIKEMYKYIKDPIHRFGVIEEEIKQHKDMAKLHPSSINALRIVTIVVDGVPHCVYVSCKMGNKGKFLDNLENDGLFCPVDKETGKIFAIAHTSKLITYEEHPITKVKFVGYKIPYVQEAIDLALKAALEVKEMRYIGWDVAITPTGPVIIEGNDYPGYDFWQQPEHTPDKIGLLPYYKNLLPKL